MVVLNKVDIATPADIAAVETALRGPLPNARFLRARFGDVPRQVLFGAERPDRHAHHKHAHGHEHGHEHDHGEELQDRKRVGEGKRGSVSVNTGGDRKLNKKTIKKDKIEK